MLTKSSLSMHKIKKQKHQIPSTTVSCSSHSINSHFSDQGKNAETQIFSKIPSFIKKMLQNSMSPETPYLKNIQPQDSLYNLKEAIKTIQIPSNQLQTQAQLSEIQFFHQKQKLEILDIFTDSIVFQNQKSQSIKLILDANPVQAFNFLKNQQFQQNLQQQKLIQFLKMKQMMQQQEQIKILLQRQQQQKQQQILEQESFNNSNIQQCQSPVQVPVSFQELQQLMKINQVYNQQQLVQHQQQQQNSKRKGCTHKKSQQQQQRQQNNQIQQQSQENNINNTINTEFNQQNNFTQNLGQLQIQDQKFLQIQEILKQNQLQKINFIQYNYQQQQQEQIYQNQLHFNNIPQQQQNAQQIQQQYQERLNFMKNNEIQQQQQQQNYNPNTDDIDFIQSEPSCQHQANTSESQQIQKQEQVSHEDENQNNMNDDKYSDIFIIENNNNNEIEDNLQQNYNDDNDDLFFDHQKQDCQGNDSPKKLSEISTNFLYDDEKFPDQEEDIKFDKQQFYQQCDQQQQMQKQQQQEEENISHMNNCSLEQLLNQNNEDLALDNLMQFQDMLF